MKNLASIILVFLLAAAISSCSRPGCSQKAGNTVTLERRPERFSHIVVQDNIDMVLKQDSTWKVTIECDENLLSSVAVSVQNDMLTVRNTASCSWVRRPGEKITAYVSLPDLNRFEYQGSGRISCVDTLHVDYLSLECDGGAGNVHLLVDAIYTEAKINNEVTDLILEGRSDTAWAWCANRGTIDFRNFRTRKLSMDYASVRDAYVWATEGVRATIFQTGNIYVKGAPAQKITDYRNSGRLLPW